MFDLDRVSQPLLSGVVRVLAKTLEVRGVVRDMAEGVLARGNKSGRRARGIMACFKDGGLSGWMVDGREPACWLSRFRDPHLQYAIDASQLSSCCWFSWPLMTETVPRCCLELAWELTGSQLFVSSILVE